MQKESSSNYYYRYKVNSELDCTPQTWARRLDKIRHNNANIILFDWIQNSAYKDEVLKAAHLLSETQFTSLSGAHLFSFQQISAFPSLLSDAFWNDFVPVIHIAIENSEQALVLDQILIDQSCPFEISLHLSPRTKVQLITFTNIQVPFRFKNYGHYFWQFYTYNSKLKGSITVHEIGCFFKKNKALPFLLRFKKGRLTSLEIWNDQIPDHFELEPETVLCDMWEFKTPRRKIQISVIIPSFNNCQFLINVIQHLIGQNISAETFEIVVVEDGGLDHSDKTIKLLLAAYHDKINLKFIYWPKSHPLRGDQSFFRAGLARNLGVRFSEGQQLVFLDSDILTPPDFLSTCLLELQSADIIQFQRFHIQQELSLLNPTYNQIDPAKHTYIEEKHYWSQLFDCVDWNQLEAFWKYTCTYALALNKRDFLEYGRFKKYYVTYGFEDTDLGYEMYRRNKKFKLVPLPLMHLTSYDKMQYKNSSLRRTALLKKTAAHFYLQHLDEKIFDVLENYFRFQKPILNILTDWL